MPRIARIVATGYPHHIIQRGNNKQAIFFNDKDKYVYLDLLKKYSKECHCQVCAYCLMSNHVHILSIPKRENSLAKMMQKISLTYTQYVNRKYKRTGRLWECRFHSSVVDTEVYLLTVCRYIERNPVRAGVVVNPIDYKWSSGVYNAGYKKSDFIVPIYNEFTTKDEYVNFLNLEEKKEDINIIEKNTYKGKPIGTQKFLNWISSTFNVNFISKSVGRPKRCVPN